MVVPRRLLTGPWFLIFPCGLPREKFIEYKVLPRATSTIKSYRQSVNNRDANAVQTAGRFVGFAREFTARVKLCHDDF